LTTVFEGKQVHQKIPEQFLIERVKAMIFKKALSRYFAAAIAILTLVGCQDKVPDSILSPVAQTVADTIYYSGKIYTVNSAQPWVEAVAIKDGRFVAVGSNKQVMELVTSDTTLVDLNGAMMMPGLHDAHFHTGHAVKRELDCTPRQFAPSGLEQVLIDCSHQRMEGYPWLVINGLEMWGDPVDKKLLDKIFSNIPVLINDVSLHNVLVNSKALELAGIDRNTPDPKGGKIIRDSITGELTGVLAEYSAIKLVKGVIPPYPSHKLEKSILESFKKLLSRGITSYQDAGTDEAQWSLINDIDSKGIPMPYITAHFRYGEGRGLESILSQREQYRTPHVAPDGVKVYLDGIPVPPAFTHVPLDENGKVIEDNLLVSRDQLAEKLVEWDKAGLKVKMHASGEGAVRVALEAIEATRKVNGDSGIRHETAHTSDVSPDDFTRFAELNAVAEISPYFWHLNSIVGQTGYQFATLHKGGALMTIGSDYPVVESFNPFPPLQGVLTREGESISRGEAIKMLTLNSAESIGRQADFGSIEVGKVANMVVLDQNLLEIPSEEVGQTQVLKTILDGNMVFDRL